MADCAKRKNFIRSLHHINTSRILVYVLMILLISFTSLPIVYLVSTAFKPMEELYHYPPLFFVRNPTLKNFSSLFMALNSSAVPFTRYVFNSIFITLATVALTVIVSSMGAFGLVKHKLPGANLIFSIVIGALMFSPYVTRIPTYMVVNKLGLFNTYASLVLPNIAAAYNFFLMKQFTEQFPNELMESSKIDGANEWRIFWKIVMPNLKPAWSTLVVFSFVSNWNDYFAQLLYINKQAMRTLPLALQTITGGAGVVGRYGAGMAAAFLMIIPTIVLFMIMQSKVLQTMVYSGIKA